VNFADFGGFHFFASEEPCFELKYYPFLLRAVLKLYFPGPGTVIAVVYSSNETLKHY